MSCQAPNSRLRIRGSEFGGTHFDHTDGNQVYPGAEIIGHESVPAAIERFSRTKEGFISGRRGRIQGQEELLKKLDPKSAEALALAESIRFNKLLIDDLAARYAPTPPTKTFSGRMDLKVADLDLKLYYFGRAHTDGDILVHIPAPIFLRLPGYLLGERRGD